MFRTNKMNKTVWTSALMVVQQIVCKLGFVCMLAIRVLLTPMV